MRLELLTFIVGLLSGFGSALLMWATPDVGNVPVVVGVVAPLIILLVGNWGVRGLWNGWKHHSTLGLGSLQAVGAFFGPVLFLMFGNESMMFIGGATLILSSVSFLLGPFISISVLRRFGTKSS